MDRQDQAIHRRAGVTRVGRQRWVKHPAAAKSFHPGSAFDEHRSNGESERCRQQPKGHIVHAREGHVRRPDHDRDEPIPEAADQRGHDHEKDHDQAMRGDSDIVEILRRVHRGLWRSAIDDLGQNVEDLDSRLLQLHPYQNRHAAADESGNNRKKYVESADIFVIGRKKITPPSGWMGMRLPLFMLYRAFHCIRGQRGSPRNFRLQLCLLLPFAGRRVVGREMDRRGVL
ncbi:MAG: hypothetical protein USCAAHI_02677 [Beijerinckiaceae bacterium]|nr:MAG: hypothetical protein USCAAHI_02677 [Beijerinckiaceae bacterium]